MIEVKELLYIYSFDLNLSRVQCIEIHYNLQSKVLSVDYRCSNSLAFSGRALAVKALLFYHYFASESHTRHAYAQHMHWHTQRPNIIFCKIGALLQFIGEHHMLRVLCYCRHNTKEYCSMLRTVTTRLWTAYKRLVQQAQLNSSSTFQ